MVTSKFCRTCSLSFWDVDVVYPSNSSLGLLDCWTPDRDLDRVPPPQVTGHAAHCAHSPQGATQAPWSQASLSRYGEHEPPRLLSRLPDPQVTEQAPQAPQREMFSSHDLDTPLAHGNWMKLV